MKHPSIQITEAQIDRAVAMLEAKWQAKNIPASNGEARQLYLRDLIECIDSLLEAPCENGWIQSPVYGIEPAEPRTLQKFLAAPRIARKEYICISDAQIERAVDRVARAWGADKTLCDFRFSRFQIKHLVLSSLVNLLDSKLKVPDDGDTVTDLARHDPRAVAFWRGLKYSKHCLCFSLRDVFVHAPSGIRC